jgi:DNA processing protein
MHNNEIACLLALWRMPGIGPAELVKLLEKYSTPQEAIKYALVEPDWHSVEQDLQWATQPNHLILTSSMFDYPKHLREITAAPPLLFVDGDAALLKHLQIAMVGSRNPTPGGADSAYHFAKFFAANGFVVTSGLALGIDAACHEGALAAKGKTIAVMGTGPDQIYPKRHQGLARKIAENGAVITEFPLGVKALAHHFPRRNRIISGLSAGVLVIEAAYGSGSLITARYALEQNREVFAIPGSIHNPLARGCHHLIKQGAKLVETAQDVVEELQLSHAGISTHVSSSSRDCHGRLRGLAMTDQPDPLSDIAMMEPNRTKIINCLGYETTSIDLLVERSGLTADQVSSILLLLELEGKIASVPGGYCRVSIK